MNTKIRSDAGVMFVSCVAFWAAVLFLALTETGHAMLAAAWSLRGVGVFIAVVTSVGLFFAGRGEPL